MVKTKHMNRVRKTWLGIALALAAVAAGPATGPTTRKALVDLSSVATEAESVAITLRQVEADAASDRMPDRVTAELPGLTAEIDARQDETSNLLASNPSLQVLDGLAGDWETIERELDGWNRGLMRRRDLLIDQTHVVRIDAAGDSLDKDEKGEVVPPGLLQKLEFQWTESRDTAQFYADHTRSDEVRQRMFENLGTIDGVVQSLQQTRDDLSGQLSTIFGLLHQVDLQRARVADVIDAVRSARDQAWDRLFQRDGDPIWAVHLGPPAEVKVEPANTTAVAPQGQGTLARQWEAVRAYVGRRRENIWLHVALVAALAAALMIARRWVRAWAEADPSLNRATLAFTAPIATALVLSFLASVWIYPQAPRLFWAGLGGAALIPTVYLLRRVVEPRLFLILDALVAFYAMDQVRLVAASVPLVARGVFLAEMLGGFAVLAFLVRARRGHVPSDVMGWMVHFGMRLWLAVFALCLLADAVGFVSLAELAGGAALGGAYLAVILYASTRIVGGLVVILLRSRPLSLLNGVRRHQPLLLRRLTGAIDWMAAAFWGVGVLAMLSARPAVFAWAYWAYHVPFHLGAIEFTPSHLGVFALTVYASFLVSRFVQFVLDEDVYVHIHLAGGLSYAINRIVHYAVVVAGVYIAVAAVGVPLTQLSLVVGALTVGLGFGLQNVVNNFVSGLILLFERPIKVGDLIQMSDATAGTVTYIGIRASIIRTPDSSEVIVPNGNLISNQLTNWTRTTRERGLMIPVSTAADAEPMAVMKLLTDVAAAHPLVVTQPRPTALLTKFGADAFSYELRAWTNSADQWAQVRSDLAVALHAALVRDGIGIK